MKIKIEYDYWGRSYRAFSYINGTIEVGLSDKSFEDAKKQLLETIKLQRVDNPPSPEEVEI